MIQAETTLAFSPLSLSFSNDRDDVLQIKSVELPSLLKDKDDSEKARIVAKKTRAKATDEGILQQPRVQKALFGLGYFTLGNEIIEKGNEVKLSAVSKAINEGIKDNRSRKRSTRKSKGNLNCLLYSIYDQIIIMRINT